MGGTSQGHLTPHATDVDGRPATYSAGGHGFPVVFLHGWGLADHSYKRALKRLVIQGCRVYAPALPGFGGTAALPSGDRELGGFASWVDAFMDAVGIDSPALVIGHSFGGGVAIRLAHDFPHRVRYLVLLNSVGAPQQRGGVFEALNRSGWLWALRAMRDPLPIGDGLQVLRAAVEDLIPNVVRHPRALVEVGRLARRADLGFELIELAKRDLPVLVLWGDQDRVLPVGAFEALCRAIGSEGTVVSGNHSWLLADPDSFGEVMSNVVDVAARQESTELAQLLVGTSMTEAEVASYVSRAAPLWLMSEPMPALAGDLALCHPPLAPNEIRAVARECDDGCFRLTIVAHDRPGLLADTTAVLAAEKLSVLRASATTWVDESLAMHSLVVEAPDDFLPDSWDILAKRLRSVARRDVAGFLFEPGGRARVSSTPQTMGRSLLSVSAPDQIGLLWAICDWLAGQEVTIEAMRVGSVDDMAHDEFIVRGAFDAAGLERRLSVEAPTLQSAPLHLVSAAVGALRRIGLR